MTNFHCPVNDAFYQASKYLTLEPQRHEMRLLKILPGRETEPIHCDLIQNISLTNDTPVYEALSYAAGSYKDTATIQVQGLLFNVFETLEIGMRRLRKIDKARVFWIDQICINQSDPTERSHQVMQMQDVYRNASLVLVWLGEPPTYKPLSHSSVDIANLAVELLEEVNSYIPFLKDSGSFPESSSFRAHFKVWDHSETMELVAELLSKNSKFDALCHAIKGMSRARWWRRCWVQQELLVSREAIIYWSEICLSWKQVKVVSRILNSASEKCWETLGHDQARLKYHQNHQKEIVMLLHLNSACIMADRHDRWLSGSQRHIRNLLRISRALESTDARDRVYAFLGLNDSRYRVSQDILIVPDYSPTSTVASRFAQVVEAVSHNGKSLDILSDGQEVASRNKTLPSWVPDFSIQQGRLAGLCEIMSVFGAASYEDPKCSFLLHGNNNPDRVLHVMVLLIGDVIPIQPNGSMKVMKAIKRDENHVEFWFIDKLPHEADKEIVSIAFGEALLCFESSDAVRHSVANKIARVTSMASSVGSTFYVKPCVGSLKRRAEPLLKGVAGRPAKDADKYAYSSVRVCCLLCVDGKKVAIRSFLRLCLKVLLAEEQWRNGNGESEKPAGLTYIKHSSLHSSNRISNVIWNSIQCSRPRNSETLVT